MQKTIIRILTAFLGSLIVPISIVQAFVFGLASMVSLIGGPTMTIVPSLFSLFFALIIPAVSLIVSYKVYKSQFSLGKVFLCSIAQIIVFLVLFNYAHLAVFGETYLTSMIEGKRSSDEHKEWRDGQIANWSELAKRNIGREKNLRFELDKVEPSSESGCKDLTFNVNIPPLSDDGRYLLDITFINDSGKESGEKKITENNCIPFKGVLFNQTNQKIQIQGSLSGGQTTVLKSLPDGSFDLKYEYARMYDNGNQLKKAIVTIYPYDGSNGLSLVPNTPPVIQKEFLLK